MPTNGTLNTNYWTTYTSSEGNAADNDGYYYTWDAAMNVCPSGWRLPSDADWKTLEGFLGMTTVQQDRMGWRGTTEGTQLKVGRTSGFESKLAGYRIGGGNFDLRGSLAFFWSSTKESDDRAFSRALYTSEARMSRNNDYMALGFSVRCLRTNSTL